MHAADSAPPRMAVLSMAGVPEAACAQEDVLWAGELIAPLQREGITPQEQQRAVIQWFLRWGPAVRFKGPFQTPVEF
jgi:hypothetical protein